MADPARARKLSDRIRVIVAETLEQRIKDPRIGFVTITEARVTGDLTIDGVAVLIELGEVGGRQARSLEKGLGQGLVASHHERLGRRFRLLAQIEGPLAQDGRAPSPAVFDSRICQLNATSTSDSDNCARM